MGLHLVWGKAGTMWTAEKQAALERSYESTGNANLRYSAEYGSKWIGHNVADCSGLFVWAFKELGGSIYHGSNTIWRRYCSAQGKLKNGIRDDGLELRPGTAVFLYNKTKKNRSHIGLYIGGGIVIEAKGTKAGVVTSAPSHWDEWGELKDVTYEGGTIPMETLRRGSRGEDVRELQEHLTALGYECGTPDGIYGAKTEAAVSAFQAAEGLNVDGIAGPMTRERLEAAWEEQQLNAQPVPHEEKAVMTLDGKTFAALYELSRHFDELRYAIDHALVTDGGDGGE